MGHSRGATLLTSMRGEQLPNTDCDPVWFLPTAIAALLTLMS